MYTVGMMVMALLLCLAQDKVADLVGKLADSNTRAQAADELVKIGKPAIEALEKDGSDPAKEVLQRICWPGVAGLEKIREAENGEPRVQMVEAEDEKLRKMFPELRVYRISFSTLQGTFSHMDTYVVKKFQAETFNMTKMAKDRKSGWLSEISRETKVTSESEVQEFVAVAGLMLGPMLYEADCVKGTGRCGGATVVKKVEAGWEFYQESCSDFATLHQIWVLETDKDGKIQKIALNPDGKRFVLDKK